MKAAIGIYSSHDLALEAILKLKESGHPVSKLTVMGLLVTEQLDEKMHDMPVSPIKPAGIEIGTIAGTALGILTGVGLFAIPGLGFLYGAGAIIGAIAGFDFGIMGGGIVTLIASLGVKDDIAKKYHDALVAGKFLVVAQGNEDEVENAKALLHAQGNYEEIATH